MKCIFIPTTPTTPPNPNANREISRTGGIRSIHAPAFKRSLAVLTVCGESIGSEKMQVRRWLLAKSDGAANQGHAHPKNRQDCGAPSMQAVEANARPLLCFRQISPPHRCSNTSAPDITTSYPHCNSLLNSSSQWFSANMSASQAAADLLKSIANFGVTDFEKNFDFEAPHQWLSTHWNVPIVAIITYLIFCFKGSKEMEPRAPFDLKMELAVWNLLLSVFSFIGMMRTAPILLARLLEGTYRDSVCAEATQSYGTGAVGFWVYLFILSKLPELIDTVFIVLRKKKLIFLHWYHHVTVLLYCWHAYATFAASGLYFVAMNYSVHALMYGYFCAQTLNKVPKSFPTYLITIFQISQMFVGTFVCISCWYYYTYTSEPCHNDFANLIAGGLMYGSYFYLFVKFAVTRFILPPRPRSKSKESKKLK